MCPSQAQLFNRNKNYNTKRIHSLVYASWTPNEKNVRWFKKVRTKLVRTKFGHRTKKTFGGLKKYVQNWYVQILDTEQKKRSVSKIGTYSYLTGV